ncbi:MAG: response regulator [Candidatus Dadabacteria bacterium]|nr:MAG: response regulator [Candidatus Dadabacteria bacterium]
MICRRLEREGYIVKAVENGLKGLKYLKSHKPDLILCDLMMPVMDGREFLKAVRQTDNGKNLPVIVLTAVGSELAEADSLELGATDFVNKTSSFDVLLARIRKALEVKTP